MPKINGNPQILHPKMCLWLCPWLHYKCNMGLHLYCIHAIGVNPVGLGGRASRFWDHGRRGLLEIILYPTMYRNLR